MSKLRDPDAVGVEGVGKGCDVTFKDRRRQTRRREKKRVETKEKKINWGCRTEQ